MPKGLKPCLGPLVNFEGGYEALFRLDIPQPEQPHEYQFSLDSDEGELALEKLLAFLAQVAPRPYESIILMTPILFFRL
jgi:hypothetical protein